MVRSARHPRTPSVAVAAAVLLGLVLAGPVLAADPPADVVLDGVVTVRFVDGVDGEPLPDATVTIEASRPEVDPVPFQTRVGQTGADGAVDIDGVAHAADGAAPVTLTISASLARANDCGGVETFDGMATIQAASIVTVELAGDASSSCAAFPILGMVLDATDQPFPVDDARATISYPGAEPETVDVEVAEDGRFGITLRAWTGEGSTEVHLTVLGTPRQVERDDCVDTIAELADVTWTLDTPVAPEPMIITAHPVVLGSVCTGTGTPAPAVTLPPTDASVAVTTGSGGDGTTAAILSLGLVGLLAFVAGVAVPARGISRRGS